MITTEYPVIPLNYIQEGIRFIHPDLSYYLDRYTRIYDVLEGSECIKSKGTDYLPRPNSEDTSEENTIRYRAYINRAVFYNVTSRTCEGLVGQVFNSDPIIHVPGKLNIISLNENNKFISLGQTAKAATTNALAYGRTGIFIDYPQTSGVITKADIQYYKPIFKVYYPWDIINWKTVAVNGVETLVLLVLREKILVSNDQDEYAQNYAERYRVLSLDDGIYKQHIYESTIVGGDLQYIDTYSPVNYKGINFNYIPFEFIGSKNNDHIIDKPPLYDLTEVNLAHYRNSADYEEACFVCGQPTLILSGLTRDWVDTVFKDKPILLGARSAIPLPVNADAKLIQAQANSLITEAMDKKEKQMIALGARLIERQVSRTAFETALDKAGEMSILENIALNVTAAFTKALNIAAEYVGAPSNDIVFSLVGNFEFTSLSNQDRLALIQEYQSDIISWTEARHVLRRGGIATQEDNKAKEEIKENSPVVDKTQEHLLGGDVKKIKSN